MDKSSQVQPKGMEMESFNRFPVVWYCHKKSIVKLFISKDFLTSWVMHIGTQRKPAHFWFTALEEIWGQTQT